jgi:hypothetical protein
MPKANHGLVVPGESMPIVLKRRSLTGMLRFMRGKATFANLQEEFFYGQVQEKAEQLEERLNELHDAVEKAVGLLNNVTAADDGTFQDSDDLQEALAELNKVL